MLIRIDHDYWVNLDKISSISFQVRELGQEGWFRCSVIVTFPDGSLKSVQLRSHKDLFEGLQMLKQKMCEHFEYALRIKEEYFDLWDRAKMHNVKSLHDKWHRDIEKEMLDSIAESGRS